MSYPSTLVSFVDALGTSNGIGGWRRSDSLITALKTSVIAHSKAVNVVSLPAPNMSCSTNSSYWYTTVLDMISEMTYENDGFDAVSIHQFIVVLCIKKNIHEILVLLCFIHNPLLPLLNMFLHNFIQKLIEFIEHLLDLSIQSVEPVNPTEPRHEISHIENTQKNRHLFQHVLKLPVLLPKRHSRYDILSHHCKHLPQIDRFPRGISLILDPLHHHIRLFLPHQTERLDLFGAEELHNADAPHLPPVLTIGGQRQVLVVVEKPPSYNGVCPVGESEVVGLQDLLGGFRGGNDESRGSA